MADTNQTFICPVCSKDFFNAKTLQKHKERHHRDKIDETYHEKKVFVCFICGKNDLRDNDKLKKHVVVCEKRRGSKDKSVMGPPRDRKSREDAKEEEKTPIDGKGGYCMKSQRHKSAEDVAMVAS